MKANNARKSVANIRVANESLMPKISDDGSMTSSSSSVSHSNSDKDEPNEDQISKILKDNLDVPMNRLDKSPPLGLMSGRIQGSKMKTSQFLRVKQ